MSCAWARDRLLLYRAGELAPRDADELRRHLEHCSRCAAEAEALAETEDLMARVLRATASAPATLDARVMAIIRREAHSERRGRNWGIVRWPRRLVAWSAALLLLLGGYLAGQWHAGRKPAPGAGVARLERPVLALALLGDDHLKYLANPQPAEVLGPDAREVSLGLMPLLNFPVAVIDLQPEGARLLGGRKCEVHGVPVAFLLYDWQGERVSLYQIDGRKLALPPLREVTFHGRGFQVGEGNGLSYVAWRAGAMHFIMVSGAKPERLLPLARRASGMSDPT
jgi:anti-sigma factor (TIGR02949 family)